jgi:hypothetical protein
VYGAVCSATPGQVRGRVSVRIVSPQRQHDQPSPCQLREHEVRNPKSGTRRGPSEVSESVPHDLRGHLEVLAAALGTRSAVPPRRHRPALLAGEPPLPSRVGPPFAVSDVDPRPRVDEPVLGAHDRGDHVATEPEAKVVHGFEAVAALTACVSASLTRASPSLSATRATNRLLAAPGG